MTGDRIKSFLLLALFVSGAAWCAAQSVEDREGLVSESAQHTFPAPTNLKVLPRDMTGQQVHDLMESWTGELGVRCAACHSEEQSETVSRPSLQSRFADDAKPMKEAARFMCTMTDANTKFLANIESSGMPGICGTCHQGRISSEAGPSPAVVESAECVRKRRIIFVLASSNRELWKKMCKFRLFYEDQSWPLTDNPGHLLHWFLGESGGLDRSGGLSGT